LVKELVNYSIDIVYQFSVIDISKEKDLFCIFSSTGEQIVARNILIACGGLSKPEQYNWIIKLGHSYEKPVPSLFTFNLPNHKITELMGVAVQQATVKLPELNLSYSGPLLITHWGLSGPSVLKLSAFGARKLYEMNYQYKVYVNWLKDFKHEDVLNKFLICKNQFPKKHIQNHCPFNDIPDRLWQFFLQQSGADLHLLWADLSNKLLNKLIEIIINSAFLANGKTTYKEEFVTAGGIKLNEIDMKSMESKLISGLYFSGEIMNVDGITGGFNFQHAWSSGYIAGRSIAEKLD
jgi:predicted Rossmann fold flavoprotein